MYVCVAMYLVHFLTSFPPLAMHTQHTHIPPLAMRTQQTHTHTRRTTTGAALEAIGHACPELREVHLRKCHWLKTWMLHRLFHGCRKIEVLDFSYVRAITDGDLTMVSKLCPDLQHVDLKVHERERTSGGGGDGVCVRVCLIVWWWVDNTCFLAC